MPMPMHGVCIQTRISIIIIALKWLRSVIPSNINLLLLLRVALFRSALISLSAERKQQS